MLDALKALFSTSSFVPHGHCYLWKTGLVGLHVAADALIALAYYSIPIALFYFVRQRKDLSFKWIIFLFGLFIISCGTTHLLEIWTLWYPMYWLSGAMKVITAVISVFTALELVPVIPELLALPNPTELQRLNEALQISQARVSGILNTASDAIISIDTNQHITLFNQAAEKVFGYTAAEAIGQPLDLLLPRRSLAAHHQHVRDFKQQNGNTRRMGERSEIFGLRKDGTEFPAEASISKLEVAGEKVLTAFLRDITDRKQAEAKLQEQQRFLRQVIDSNPSLIFVKDWDGRFTLANQALAEVYNTTIEEVIGKTDIDFCPNLADAEQFAHADRLVMQTLTPLLNLEETFTTEAGTIRYFQSTKKPLISPDGKTRYVLGVANDITTLKQTEAALQQKTEELEVFFSSTLDLLCIANIEGYFLRLNPEWQQTLGYKLPELEGKRFLDFVHPEDLELTLTAVAQLAQQQSIFSFTNRYRHQNGTYRWFEWRSVPKGKFIYASARDITDHKYAEAELRLSQERLQLAVEASGEGLWDWQIETGEVYRSHRYLEILGYDDDKFPENVKSWEELLHSDDKARVFDLLTAHLQDNSLQFACEYRMQTKSGEWKWIADYGKVVAWDEQGKPIRMIGTHRDISDQQAALQERERTEALLRQSEERLRLALKAAKFGTWEYNFVTNDLFQSDISDIYGLNPGETHRTYEEWKAQVHPDDRVRVQTEFEQAMQVSGEFSSEFRIVRSDGTERWTLSTGAVVQNQTGEPLYAYGIAADITDRKLAEAEQHAQQVFLRQVIDTVPNIIFVKNKGGRILIVNQAGADAHGTTVEAMLGKRETDFNPNFSAEQLKEFLLINQQVMQTRQPHTELSQSIVNATGKECWYQTVINPLINVDGQVIGIVGATTDVTDLKHAEQVLQQAKEIAEAANQAKSLFLANMSHELRTPLNVILGFAQVMYRDQRLTPEQRENLQIIRRSGDHLLNLINDVLDFSKIEAGHISLDETRVDLIDLLRSLEQMLCQRAEAKGLQLQLELAPDLPQYVTIDASKLRQVLINLLGNAIKFTQQGHITLRVNRNIGAVTQQSAHSSLHPDTILDFEVSDTGIGIAPSELESIFSAFVQTQAGKISPDGTGLGLTISRKFVQLMSGDIRVKSILGQGSTFTVTIPVHLAQAPDVLSSNAAGQVIGLAPGQTAPRVLVVDDHPENRKLLVSLLTQIGLEVREAINGQEAVTQWQQWQPHLIYMDIRMPLLNGYEATQQIRATPNGHAPIIIALTAQASKSDRTLALSSGCNDYLSKPFHEEDVFSHIAEHLGLKYLRVTGTPALQDEATSCVPTTLQPSDLLVMPSSWIAALRHAAQLCDDNSIEDLIAQIPSEWASLIRGLHQLVQTYSFKQIIILTTSGAGSTDDNNY